MKKRSAYTDTSFPLSLHVFECNFSEPYGNNIRHGEKTSNLRFLNEQENMLRSFYTNI